MLQPLAGQEVPGWDLVWSDEFSQADGSLPDPSKWGYDIGGSGWGNQEIQYYTSRSENARIEGGQLLIEAREESFGGRNHTSARLLTKGKWDWTYGRFEARVKVPSGTGLWPACWMLGADIDTVGWPNCGEIDIMEFVGRLPKEVFGTLHGPGYSGGDSVGGIYTFAADVPDDYHVFVVEWDENLIRWYVDGINYFSATPASLGGDQWVFDHDHFMILNLAIDGNFAGPLDPAVTFPKQMWVDYVRVYSRSQPAGSNLLLNTGLESGVLSPWIGYSLGGVNDEGGYIESTSYTYYNGGNSGGDNVLTHSGEYVAKVFGDFDGNENYHGFYQDVTAAPGSQWSAEGWALTHPQDLMAGDNSAWIEVTFRDSGDQVLALYRSETLTTSNITPGSWMNLKVSEEFDPVSFSSMGTVTEMEAPAGTSNVRYQVVFRQPAYDGGSMYFDDLSLLQVPEPEDFRASIRPGTVVSWSTSGAESSYQVQESADNSSWTDLGPLIIGDSESSLFDGSESAYYQVIETAPDVVANGIANPGFETSEAAIHPSPGAPGWTIQAPEDVDPSDGTAAMSVESSYSTSSPNSGSRMLVIESSTPASPASVVAPNSQVRSALSPVEGNTPYEISFYAAHVVKTGGANPQFNLRYYNDSMSFVSESGYESFSSIGSAWTKVSKAFTTPSEARWVTIEWIQALGAGNDFRWVTLIDDVELPSASAPGAQSVIAASADQGVEISWDTELGSTYQAESGADLDSFGDFGSVIVGDGGPAAVFDVINTQARFYRVEKLEAP
ncbi:glycoside hydrolase family 16 protein [Haloferula sp.]|uniref:glycoside hydrolase family 16 protein n=1 Tax=Haloferula sp. TaxID=2497595 RepID=UPI00329F5772